MAGRLLAPAMASADDTFRYSAQDYPAAIMKILSCLRQDNIYCDVRLQVETEIFPCHRVVLMASSQYFHAMFSSEMTEHDKDVVTIGAVSAEIFASLLDFIYSGEIAVTKANCEDLLAAADMLSVTGVVDACCSFLKDRLHPDNCIGVYMFADNISCDKLTRNAEVYMHQHFLEVVRADEFCSMPKDVLVHFLSSESLGIENEYQVFKAAMDWILHNPADRRKYIFEIMKPVRFPIIPEKQMDKYIQLLADTDISMHVALQKILSDFRSVVTVTYNFFRSFSPIKPHLTVPRKYSWKQIYVVGGYGRTRAKGEGCDDTLNVVERYDTFYKTWHDVPSFQFHRSGCGAGVINGQVCVVGGENDSLLFDSVETYDPVTHDWTLLPGMTTPRYDMGVCTMDNCLYALGGWASFESGSTIVSTIDKYDPNDSCWSVIGHCHRFSMGVTASNGLIYVVGGYNDFHEEHVATVESFNPVTNEWVTLPDLITNRASTGVTVLDDYLYAVGGRNHRYGALNTVERLCISSALPQDQWTEVSPIACGRTAACVVTVNNMLYVLGGSHHTFTAAPTTLDSMECYDPKTDTWTEMSCMPTGRCAGAAVVI